MVALALGAIVLVTAHRIASGVLDGVRRAEDTQTYLDRDMNGRRVLVEAFGSLDVGPENGGFTGRSDRVEFATWERTASGWLVPTRRTLALRGDTLMLQGDARLDLRTSVTSLDFDYLLDPGANASWVREWISPVSAPIAVRVRVASRTSVDTLLFLVGPRG